MTPPPPPWACVLGRSVAGVHPGGVGTPRPAGELRQDSLASHEVPGGGERGDVHVQIHSPPDRTPVSGAALGDLLHIHHLLRFLHRTFSVLFFLPGNGGQMFDTTAVVAADFTSTHLCVAFRNIQWFFFSSRSCAVIKQVTFPAVCSDSSL